MGTTMIRTIASIIRSLRSKLLLAQYDEFTIAEHLRREGTQIGENCRIMIYSLGPEPYLVRIGNHCTIAPGVALSTSRTAAHGVESLVVNRVFDGLSVTGLH